MVIRSKKNGEKNSWRINTAKGEERKGGEGVMKKTWVRSISFGDNTLIAIFRLLCHRM